MNSECSFQGTIIVMVDYLEGYDLDDNPIRFYEMTAQ